MEFLFLIFVSQLSIIGDIWDIYSGYLKNMLAKRNTPTILLNLKWSQSKLQKSSQAKKFEREIFRRNIKLLKNFKTWD